MPTKAKQPIADSKRSWDPHKPNIIEMRSWVNRYAFLVSKQTANIAKAEEAKHKAPAISVNCRFIIVMLVNKKSKSNEKNKPIFCDFFIKT